MVGARRRPVRWLVLPGRIVASVAAMLALYYASFTIQIPPEDAKLLWGLGVATLVAMQGVVQLYVRRRLPTLRALDALERPATKGELLAAVREVLSFPNAYGRIAIAVWVGGAAGLALAMRAFGAATSWELALRIALIGVLFGPFVSLLSYVIQVLRVRKLAIELGARGLSADELATAVPPSPARIRTRLVAMMMVLVVVPGLLSAQVAVTLANERIDRARALGAAAGEGLYGEIVASVAVLFVLVLALTLAIAWIAGATLVVPLARVARAGRRIAEGDLTARELVLGEQEVWKLSGAYRTMQTRLGETLSPLNAAGLRLGETTRHLSTSVEEQRTGAAEQTSALTETSATTEELARSAGQISESAAEVADLAQRTLRAARGGRKSSQAFLDAMEGMTRQRRQIAEAVLSLNERVQRVGKIVDFINGVSDKSDLLALNAELEGTKAGDVGRGFSLVAAEMRRLAENTIRSTQEISRLIHEIREASQVAVLTTEGGLRVTEQAGERAEAISHKLGEILELAEQTTDQIDAIRTSTLQQQTGTDQLALAMGQVLKVTEESTAVAERVEHASESLQKVSTTLATAMTEFRLGEERRR